jgi:hypothetical protein
MTSRDTVSTDLLAANLEQLLKPALQRWGRHTSTDYSAFQPIVALRLVCVEDMAIRFVNAESQQRQVHDSDRQRAVWYCIREALACLYPPANALPSEVQAALDTLSRQPWPRDLLVPQECHQYLMLYLAYATKSHTNQELAIMFDVSIRSIASIRNQAIAAVARQIAGWETNCWQHGGEQLDLSVPVRVSHPSNRQG